MDEFCAECGADLEGTICMISTAHRESCYLHTDHYFPQYPEPPRDPAEDQTCDSCE